MIPLATNILSELMRPASEKGVGQWLAHQPDASVSILAITEAELRYGVALLPPDKRRFTPAAVALAEIALSHRQATQPIAQADAQIAATARSRGAIPATRNTRDLVECVFELINPCLSGCHTQPNM